MKNYQIPDETIVDVLMIKQTDYKDALRLREAGLKKGWKVKIGQKEFLKNGNKIY